MRPAGRADYPNPGARVPGEKERHDMRAISLQLIEM
jgi:hypothetical protein